MEIRELCRKLKPVIGSRADQYWLAYLAEDGDGKRELETALQLLALQCFGNDVERLQVQLSAPTPTKADGDYRLGTVVYADKAMHPFGLREDEWLQHVAVFGRSGAGKTNTLFKILAEFLEKGTPFLIFDWKRNYRDLLAVREEEIQVYTVGRSIVPLAFNPLIPPEDTEPAVWLKKLIEIIAHAYYLGEGVMFLLQEALHDVYNQFGVYRGRVKRYPTFNDVYRWLEEHPAKGRKALWMDSAMRGIKSICFGHMGQVVNTPDPCSLGKLLEKNVILELDGLSNADKTLITESMLLWIHHYRMRQPDREIFKHAIIIEEAHHILSKQSGSSAEPITETILREIRELGEALIFVDQCPSTFSPIAIANTYTTICMNLKHRSDVSAMASAMLLDEEERQLLGEIPIGTAIVKLQGRWTRPFLLQVPYQKIPKGQIDDSTLIQRMEALLGVVPNPAHRFAAEATPLPAVNEQELRLLKDIAIEPYSGVVERYKRLGASRRKGNDWKEALLLKELIVPVKIPTRSGAVVLLELANLGRSLLRQYRVDVPNGSPYGGLEHEYWKNTIATALEQRGHRVQLELGDGHRTDLIATKDGATWAVEIETGKSDWKGNIQKNRLQGHDKILILATNEEAYARIEQFLTTESPRQRILRLLHAWDFLDRARRPSTATINEDKE